MTVHGVSVYPYSSGEFVPPVPGAPDPGPGTGAPAVPDQPGEQGYEWLVAVANFGSVGNNLRGIFAGAVIESLTICVRELGPQRVDIRVPATAHNLRVWGTVTSEVDQAGGPLAHVRGSVAREILIGSSEDGLVRWRFFCRDEVRVEGGFLRISAVGIVGGLTADRVLGSIRGPHSLMTGSFEWGDLRGWAANGVTAEVVPGGVDVGHCVRIRGNPDGVNCLQAHVRWTVPASLEFGNLLASAYVRLPNIGAEIEGYGLMTVTVTEVVSGNQIWPWPGRGNDRAAVVDMDMPRGTWLADQIVAGGGAGPAPFDVWVDVKLFPLSATEWTYFDKVHLFPLSFFRVLDIRDRADAVRDLMVEAQSGRDKRSWGVGVIKKSSMGTLPDHRQWSTDENPRLDEILEELLAEDPPGEVWDDAETGRNIAAGARRGQVRSDLVIQPWHVLGRARWTVDPGAQATGLRAQNASGASVLGAIDVGVIDTSRSGGHLMEVVLRGPSAMRQRDLGVWVRRQLERMSILQGSTSLLLRWDVGMRLAVGDSVRVAVTDGAAMHVDWMRVMSWQPDLVGQAGVLVQFGTDVDLGGA